MEDLLKSIGEMGHIPPETLKIFDAVVKTVRNQVEWDYKDIIDRLAHENHKLKRELAVAKADLEEKLDCKEQLRVLLDGAQITAYKASEVYSETVDGDVVCSLHPEKAKLTEITFGRHGRDSEIVMWYRGERSVSIAEAICEFQDWKPFDDVDPAGYFRRKGDCKAYCQWRNGQKGIGL